MSGQQWIVAEISANWINGGQPTNGPIGRQFEHCIEVNEARGYELHSWQMGRVVAFSILDGRPQQEINETIIAVFERRPM